MIWLPLITPVRKRGGHYIFYQYWAQDSSD